MCKMLGSLSTETMDFRRLSQEIEIHTGGLSFGIESYDDVHHFGDFTSNCYVKGKAVAENIPTLISIMTDVITKTRYQKKPDP